MNPRRANVWTLLAGQFGPLLALLLVFVLFAVADATQPKWRPIYVAAKSADHARLLSPGRRRGIGNDRDHHRRRH